MVFCKNRRVGEREVDEGGAGGGRNIGKLRNNLEAKKTGALLKGIAKLKLRYSYALA